MNKDVPVSGFLNNCSGYQNAGNIGEGYLLGFVIGVGKTKISNTPLGSNNLEKIDAFDKAEVEDTNIGQINMITVSSFCGPMGKIWGYDLARDSEIYVKDEYTPEDAFSLKPLMSATKSLFGTVENPSFPLMPGAHVPCASKYISDYGPTYLYCSLTIGIAQDRKKNACLLMEDIGTVDLDTVDVRKMLLEKAVESIYQVGENQKVQYKEIFTDLKLIKIESDEVGCALVAAPYFAIAQKAVPKEKSLFDINLKEWESEVLK